MRLKLILTFLAVTAISITAVAYFTNRATQTELTKSVSHGLSDLSTLQAQTIGGMLNQEVDNLQAFALSKVVQDLVADASNSYHGDLTAIRADIDQKDHAWIAAPDSDPLIQERLTNTVASELREYHDSFPENLEVFVTDKYGALMSATNRTSDYNQADEPWWQTAYNNGVGGIYIGQPEYDQSAKASAIIIAIPLFAHDTKNVVGVMRTTFRLTSLTDLLAAIRVGETGKARLLLPDNTILQPDGQPITLDAATIHAIKAITPGGAVEIAAQGRQRLTSQAPVGSGDPQHAKLIIDLGWALIIDQDSDEAFQPISAAFQATLITGGGAMATAAVLAFILAQILAAPIIRLTHVVQQFASGDLSQRAGIDQRDEIGTLAGSFNTMAQSLEQRIGAEQAAFTEARRLQQIEADGRQLLEQTVAEYLVFVQQVAQGDLTQRLSVSQGGALGQMGAGLNDMVVSLHTITSQVQQANANIATAAAEILAATTQQAASAAEQSAALTQTTTTIEEVKAIAEQTAHQASQVAHESQSALGVARQGTQAVEETVVGMGQIRARVESIAQTILALAEQTQAIGAIITTVNELADQSNLLALNAAIEAARAGEQGRSFAVVAQHVRDLAERSKAATAQVREILGEIQKATNAAVLVTEEGTKGVEVGGRLVGQAGQVIHRIATEVESGAQANVQIAAAAQQQTVGMVQIGQAMTSIAQATTQALASTRQAERAAQDLHTLAQSLQRNIAVYRL
jgi:methyl-accepting chemotaxis protein